MVKTVVIIAIEAAGGVSLAAGIIHLLRWVTGNRMVEICRRLELAKALAVSEKAGRITEDGNAGKF